MRALEAALDNGIAAHVDFIEVYEEDVLHTDLPAIQSVLQRAVAGLASDQPRELCPHLPYVPPGKPRPAPGGADSSAT